ncbi:MAG: transglycosylase SLT domain-containing protein [Candidatus Adiutrix sp.]|jgi:hypothetical protein|nr:transglycosylase SLT domain-containing protein [Candidatus Adiutrix sp.]
MRPLLSYIALGLVMLGLAGCFGRPESREDAAPAPDIHPPSAGLAEAGHLDHRLPPQVSLCGEPLDLSRPSVYERLDFEFLRVVNHPAQVALWQRRAATHFPAIEAALKAAGLPDDLKYLAVAESDLRPWVSSPAGALGLWQFMPSTARHFGLTVSDKVDQRQLPENILKAAAGYLKELHGRFGNWALALAAYNGGESRVARAMAAQGVSDYYELDLPRETERYVYRIAAIKVVLENAAAYGLAGRTPPAAYAPVKFQEKRVTVAANTTWTQLAKQIGCDYKTLRMLNPHLLESAPPAGPLVLRTPAGK